MNNEDEMVFMVKAGGGGSANYGGATSANWLIPMILWKLM